MLYEHYILVIKPLSTQKNRVINTASQRKLLTLQSIHRC